MKVMKSVSRVTSSWTQLKSVKSDQKIRNFTKISVNKWRHRPPTCETSACYPESGWSCDVLESCRCIRATSATADISISNPLRLNDVRNELSQCSYCSLIHLINHTARTARATSRSRPTASPSTARRSSCAHSQQLHTSSVRPIRRLYRDWTEPTRCSYRPESRDQEQQSVKNPLSSWPLMALDLPPVWRQLIKTTVSSCFSKSLNPF